MHHNDNTAQTITVLKQNHSSCGELRVTLDMEENASEEETILL